MGYSEVVQWWQEEQLRILVLSSLILQYLLLLAAILRKSCVRPLLKFYTWLAYLASDAVAIYALATLFNRHRKKEWVSTHRHDASLEALWAPILLLHLGGLDVITAYNIEDNELWSRHFLTAVSQIAVAIYVVRKSWSWGDRLLQAATILIFVTGVLKCMEKPLALRRASINSIQGEDENVYKDQGSGSANTKDCPDDLEDNDPAACSLDEYIQNALMLVWQIDPEELFDEEAEVNKPSDNKRTKSQSRCTESIFGGMPDHLFVDLACSYIIRLMNIRYMMQRKGEAHSLVRCGLSRAFDRLYTRKTLLKLSAVKRSVKRLGIVSRFLLVIRTLTVYLPFAAVGLFHKSNRESYNATDVNITYTMICCSASLPHISSFISLTMSLSSHWTRERPEVCAKHPWPDQVAQYNLIGYLAHNNKYQGLRRLLPNKVKDYIDQLWCLTPCSKYSSSITELVHNHVMDGWRNCIHDTTTYRMFNDVRGQRTLMREGFVTGSALFKDISKVFNKKGGNTLEMSLLRPLDESVILWHLATDFCFHHEGTAMSPSHDVALRCRVMSNYMAYLLYVNPEMLMPGARRNLFKEAYGELKELVAEYPSSPMSLQNIGRVLLKDIKQLVTRKQSPRDIVHRIVQKQKVKGKGSDLVLVQDAWALSLKLKNLAKREKGEEKMWRVIQGVWVEMLCFSAGRCRGFLHAKSLGTGGEYLSYVWLLMWYMGMETFAERLQRLGDPDNTGDVRATRKKPPRLHETGYYSD